VRQSGDIERSAPVAITVLAQVEVMADAMEAHGEQPHAGPATQLAIDEGHLGRLGLEEHRGACGAEAMGRSRHGTRFTSSAARRALGSVAFNCSSRFTVRSIARMATHEHRLEAVRCTPCTAVFRLCLPSPDLQRAQHGKTDLLRGRECGPVLIPYDRHPGEALLRDGDTARPAHHRSLRWHKDIR